MRSKANIAFLFVLVLILFAASASADQLGLDYPHNATNSINCWSCHYNTDNPASWATHVPQDIDDTPWNNLCWSCHNDVDAQYVLTHSSLNAGDDYGEWTIECKTCHWVHHQRQLRAYGADSYVYTATTAAVTASTVTRSGGTAWTVDAYAGYIVVPNVNQVSYNYMIVSNTEDTLTVEGPIDLTKVTAGVDTMAIIYGNLIKDEIETPNSGTKTVKFFNNTGPNSFADGDSTRDGVCEVCHTQTDHFRNDGNAPDQLHDNLGGKAGTDCIDCHAHNGFGHGGGGGTGCEECHGHDPGYGGATGGHGTYVSHSTHTENDADDLKGPNVGCSTCHDTNNFPNFADGATTLAATTVCDTCHSPGGTYDGVDDPVVGAKNNWRTAIYDHSGGNDSTLQAGKEKWCATCHDEEPAQISGVNAPNVIGDEDGSYTYGTGWGFYKTGHGLASGEAYPYKGGLIEPSLVNGATRPVECDSCHDFSTAHIDGNARTYDDGGSSSTDPSVYRQAYRLDQVAMGQGTGTSTREPLLVPWPQNSSNVANNSRLCFNCHDSGPFLNSADMNTNLVTAGVNRHEYHLVMNSIQYPADWNGGNTSNITCVVCHNVHGSTWLAMIRDGALTGREPGLEIWYKNDAITTNIGTANPPVPADLPLAASDGTAWISNTVHNLCVGCHNTGILEGRDRTPFQETSQVPTLDWTGESGYVADGAGPDAAPSGSTFTFRVKYTDTNNDAPNPSVQVWVDVNDNGTYEVGEKYAMSAVDSGDVNYMNGKLYTKNLAITSAGDNHIKYRFYSSDGTDDATGDPTGDSSITILNNAPTLTWTGETNFSSDGVNPDTGGNGVTFEFRVSYTDADNDQPAAIQVWVDANDNGTYESGEKYDVTAVDGGDTTYTDGKLYTKSLAIAHAGDGSLTYRFYATDGTDSATGSPVANSSLTVQAGANSPPVLEWDTATCRAEGVKPASGANGGTFEFHVKYTDPDDECPPTASNIQVWVDLDDSNTYEPGEKYNLTADEPGDLTCSDGKLYSKSMSLALAGDNTLNYRFVASDGTDAAAGTPASDHSLTVVDAYKVRTTGGSGWYSSIQTAIDDARSGNKMVLVYEGTYDENLSLWQSNYSNTTVRSVCGPDSTIIEPSGGGEVVFLQNVSGITIDGFGITGGTRGVNSNGGSATINNCKIHDNNKADGGGGGLNSGNASGILTVTNSEIYSNTSSENGGGASYGAGAGHSFTNTIIRDNESTGGGGGAVFTQNGSVTFTDVTIEDNTSSGGGGAVYSNGSDTTFSRCTITGNTATGGTGGVLYNSNSSCDAVFENCIIAGNSATGAGVSYVNQGTLSIINSTLADNQATAGDGGAIRTNTGTTTIRNSILWGNTASGDGHIAYTTGSMTITDTVIASGGDGDFTNAPYFAGSGTPSVSGYVSENDPNFVDAADNDYHLQSPSDAIDNASATYAPADDIDGDSRPQGAADDIGADEYTSSTGTAPSLTWTGESNYTADGVDPDNAAGGSSFTFRIDYTDADNNAPVLIQVWVDENDDGAYSGSEKYDMTATDAGDTDYTDGKRYSKTLNLAMAGDGSLKYRFYAMDGTFEATGTPTSNSAVTVTNNVPTLAWTGEANYTTDGVDPDSAVGGSSFTFRIDYTDADNTEPSSIQVWVDEDDSGSYEAGEKYDMTATDGGDTTYTDGKRYTKALNLLYAGNGSLTYRFYASDGAAAATGTPSSNKTVSITNNAPTLSWTGETNYISDGVNPNSGPDASDFEFRIDYTDTDNTGPSSIQVWVDENNNGSYESGEKYDMTATDSGDTTYTDGKRYTKTLTLAYTGDGVYNYRFHASDGTDEATGTPTSDSTVTVTFTPNNAPTLDWTGETNYTTDGVDPDSSYDGDTFTFRVEYTDADNEAPSSIQVWIDENDNSTYEAGEKYDMTPVDGGDSDYTDGKLYTVDRTLAFAGDGSLTYRFFANDGTDDATGAPAATGGTVTVVNAITVCSTGADFTTIQGAISDAGTTDGDFIRVCDGTYSENINFNGKNITIYSQNGAISTTIQGSGADSPVVTFSSGETTSAVLQGFTINNQTTGGNSRRGIVITNNSSPTIKNSIIKGNVPASYVSGAGIYIDGGGATIENSTIGDETDYNSSTYGTAINAQNAGPALTITDSDLIYNRAGNQGGAIYIKNRSTTTTLTNTTVTNNTAVQAGGGIYADNAPLVIANSTIDYNSSTQPLEGGGLCLNGSSTTLTITGTSSISHNSGRNGGAINASGIGAISISDTTIDNNSATSQGAGMTLSGITGNVSLTNTNVTNNTGTTSGAGIYFNTSSAISFTLTNSTVDNNSVTASNYDCCGVCIAPSDVSGADITATITGSTISGNSARNAGGLSASSGSYSTIDLTITGSTISSNEAIGGAGGGLSLGGGNTTVDISKSWIKGNKAHTYGGGIYNTANTTITNSFITGNLAEGVSYNDGGGINTNASITIYNSTIAGNRTGRNGGGWSGGGTITNSIFWGNTAGGSNNQINGSPTVTYTDVAGGFTGTGNIDSDPYFVDLQAASAGNPTTAGNFHLCNGAGDPDPGCTGSSAAIDAASATNAPADDYDGDTRPEDIGGKGDGVDDYDMGADEYVP